MSPLSAQLDSSTRTAVGTTAVAAAAAALVTAGAVALRSRYANYRREPRDQLQVNAITSPRDTLTPYLDAAREARLAYPTDIMPGARDVATPFGVMRVNEWGPTDGRRVVFVHGDATPSPLWARMADGLVKRGCRVLTFDLWGRGYTDTPLDCPHELRYFVLQVLFAVDSSPVSWTGPGGFSMVGFSLGGAVSLSFAGTFPNLVRSVVLLGPAGLGHVLPDGYKSFWFRQPWLAPSATYLRRLVAAILEVEPNNSRNVIEVSSQQPRQQQQQQQKKEKEKKSVPPVDEATWTPPDVDAAALLQWQYDYHRGHVRSFYDTAANSLAKDFNSSYPQTFDIIAGKTCSGTLLHDTRIIVFLGDQDSVVPAEKTKDAILTLLPASRVDFVVLPGGHGFPLPNSETITKHIVEFWEL